MIFKRFGLTRRVGGDVDRGYGLALRQGTPRSGFAPDGTLSPESGRGVPEPGDESLGN